MKYVYVLASDEKDLFLEQALLSVISLRKKVKNADVAVLADDITAGGLTGRRAKIKDLAEIISVPFPRELDKVKRSRWLKTTIREAVSGDFLYIDCDTVIAGDVSAIADTSAETAAVLDQHCLIEDHPLKKRIQSLDKKSGFSSALTTNKHFNGGVFFCRDTPAGHEFFNEWHKLWRYCVSKNILVDQPSLNQANVNLNGVITELDGSWNCQIEFNGLKYLQDVKIIHYFSSNRNEKPYLLADPSIFYRIKESGSIPPDIEDLLEDPRSLFLPQIRLVSDKRMLAIIDSALFDYILTRTFNKKDRSPLLESLSSAISGFRRAKGGAHDFLQQVFHKR